MFAGWFDDTSSIFGNLVSEAIGSLVSPLNNILNGILAIPGAIVDGISDLFNDLFVPSDDFFTSRFDSIKNTVSSKFSVNTDINIFSGIGADSTKFTSSLSILGTTYQFDFSNALIIAPYTKAFFNILIGFLLIRNLMNRVLLLIGGRGMIVGGEE